MIREGLAAGIFIYLTCELAACGGELKADVDATTFDLDAHWGECCYFDKGPTPYCPSDAQFGGGGLPNGWYRCEDWQYCGVPRDCPNTHGPNPECHSGLFPVYACCGSGNTPTHPGPTTVPEGSPDWFAPGMDLDCLPVALDDGAGLPSIPETDP